MDNGLKLRQDLDAGIIEHNRFVDKSFSGQIPKQPVEIHKLFELTGLLPIAGNGFKEIDS